VLRVLPEAVAVIPRATCGIVSNYVALQSELIGVATLAWQRQTSNCLVKHGYNSGQDEFRKMRISEDEDEDKDDGEWERRKETWTSSYRTQ
jgi:hypothetical protein